MLYKDLKGKRLLLMSGSRDACEIVNIAKNMGVLVYATDFYETSPVKEIADKSFMVSTADVEAVAELCEREKINGCLLYTSPSPRDKRQSRMPSSA